MSGVNKVFLVGYFSETPQIKFAAHDYVFRLGTKERIRKGNGAVDHTEWHKVVLTRQQTELASRLLTPETLVSIEGNIQTRSYREGTITRYDTEIIAHRFTILGRKGDFEFTLGMSKK